MHARKAGICYNGGAGMQVPCLEY